MIGKITRYAGYCAIAVMLMTSAAPAQNPQPQVQTAPANAANANDTRDQLRQLLQDFPPALGEVLRLDPSLLTNQEFMIPYPRLAAFVAQHPEVLRNPAYYVGEGRQFREPNTVAGDMVEFMSVALVIGTLIGTLTWIIRSVIDHRRWLRMFKVQTDVHTKLLDRFAASEDLLAYIQTNAGKRFLESAPISLDTGSQVSAPFGRILLSVQVGMVLACGGVGMLYASGQFDPEVARPFFVLGVLGIALGLGFVLSAVVSYAISRSMGLVNPPATSESTSPPI